MFLAKATILDVPNIWNGGVDPKPKTAAVLVVNQRNAWISKRVGVSTHVLN